MFVLNQHPYKLVGLDSNVVSAILREPTQARKGLVTLFPPGEAIPCFSPYTLFGLRAHSEVWKEFLKFFDIYPCLVLKNEEQLCEAEIRAYPDPSGVTPWIKGFSKLNEPRGTNLRAVIDAVFSTPAILETERTWPAFKLELLEEWNDLKANFPPVLGVEWRF